MGASTVVPSNKLQGHPFESQGALRIRFECFGAPNQPSTTKTHQWIPLSVYGRCHDHGRGWCCSEGNQATQRLNLGGTTVAAGVLKDTKASPRKPAACLGPPQGTIGVLRALWCPFMIAAMALATATPRSVRITRRCLPSSLGRRTVVISPRLGSPRLLIAPRSRRCFEMVLCLTPHLSASADTVSSSSAAATCRNVIACVVDIRRCIESRTSMALRKRIMSTLRGGSRSNM